MNLCKKMFLFFTLLLLVFSLVSCKENTTHETVSNPVNFNLNQYESHGSLSEGLIYVIKSAGTSTGETLDQYAYMDVDGNIIYGWQTMATYYNKGFFGLRGVYPQDFKNGLALIYDRSCFSLTFPYAQCMVIDKNGNVIAQFYADASEKTGTTAVDVSYKVSDTEGYAFFFGMGNDTEANPYGLYFLNETGIHRFPLYDIPGRIIDYIDVLNNKYLYISLGQYQLYDNNGNLILDIDDSCGFVPTSIEILDNKYIEATYEKDGEYYVSVIDFTGTEVNPTVLEKDYVRDGSVVSVEYGAESIEELIQVIEDLSVSNCYEYVTNLTFFYQLDSDETLLDCLMNPQRNIRMLTRKTNNRLIENENYYYSNITVTDYKKSSIGKKYVENNYKYALSNLDMIAGTEDLKAEFKNEFEGIEEIYELRGQITSSRSNSNTNMASSKGHKLCSDYYKNETMLPFIFKINGRYYLGFMWC